MTATRQTAAQIKRNARFHRAERYRAAAIARLSVELSTAARIGAPRWERNASPKAHFAWETREAILHLIAYVANMGPSFSYTVSELMELAGTAANRGTISMTASVAIAEFLKAWVALADTR
jgi:hypothetical protein